MDVTVIIETKNRRIMKRLKSITIEESESPKDVLYAAYQELKQSITKKEKKNE